MGGRKWVEGARLKARWRKRRNALRFTLTPTQAGFLNAVLRAPALLGDAVAMLGQPNFAHYQAKEEQNQRMMVALRKWLEKYVLEEKEDGIFAPREADVRVGLTLPYINQVKTVMKHYSAIGKLTVGSEPYLEIMDILEEREHKVDDPMDYGEGDDVTEKIENDPKPKTMKAAGYVVQPEKEAIPGPSGADGGQQRPATALPPNV